MTIKEGPATAGLADEIRIERVNGLLQRYPDLTASEVAEVRSFLSSGPILAIGRVTGNDSIQAQLAAFRRDHPALTGPSPGQLAAIGLAVSALVALIMVLLWDAGA